MEKFGKRRYSLLRFLPLWNQKGEKNTKSKVEEAQWPTFFKEFLENSKSVV